MRIYSGQSNNMVQHKSKDRLKNHSFYKLNVSKRYEKLRFSGLTIQTHKTQCIHRSYSDPFERKLFRMSRSYVRSEAKFKNTPNEKRFIKKDVHLCFLTSRRVPRKSRTYYTDII